MTLKYEKIIPTKIQIKKLYQLLLNKKYSISHKELPSLKEHEEFVLKNPYLEWYLIYKNGIVLGSVYIQSDNSIGINLNNLLEDDIMEVIGFIKTNHQPLCSIKSQRRGEFYINVSPDNLILIKILIKLNKKEIQRTFVI